ncbi:hypothetical protein NIB75_23205 [Bacteroides uniformis]|nr:hypothetical protein [Bacteroides uniformis]
MPNYDKRVLSYSSSYFQHLSGEVTPEESRFLDKWRKESKSHEQLFQKICSDEHYAQHEIRKMEFDSQAGWKGVETRIKRMELRRRHLKLLRYVALFIAPVLILVFALQGYFCTPCHGWQSIIGCPANTAGWSQSYSYIG